MRLPKPLSKPFALTLGTLALAALWWPLRAALWPDASELAALRVLAGSAHDGSAALRLRLAAATGQAPAARMLGLALVDRGDEAGAQRWLQPAAEAGDAPAQLALGKLLYRQHDARAIAWLTQAAAHGQPAAAHYLALLHKNGAPGLPADARQAERWLRIAAGAGIADSQFLLAQMLLADHPAEARSWLEKAAEQEHPEAAQQLAMAYQRGELGLPADPQAAAQQLAEARHALHHRPPSP
jgi:TPR repeat protein